MTSPLRRLACALSLVLLIASGCSSSSDDVTATDTTAATTEASTKDEDAAGSATADTDTGESAEVEATSIPVPADDDAADQAIAGLDDESIEPEEANADPADTVQSFARGRFNIDPEPDWISCVTAESENDEVLELALRTPAVGRGEVDDTQLRALTFAMNGCVSTLSLADWATQAIGPQGDVAQTAPPCLVERFENPDNGDLTFYTFVALTYQFRLDPDGSEGLVDALTECAPITSLGDFFASQAEQASNFESVVDRACLQEQLAPAEVSRQFWGIFVEGGLPPVEVITPYTDACAETPTSDLATAVPDDFVPWSGTGALANVRAEARAGIYTAPPPMTLTAGADYEAVLSTGGNDIRIRLYPDTAPVTVNNFVSLARDGYYDGTVFHRVLAEFMAQAGDPTGTGSGGPGYQFEDEVENGPALDRKGLLAMANAGPGTNGSQFFITFVPTDWLTGNHTVFGEVIEGIEIVDAIELRDPAAPSGRGQVIDSITIIEN